MPGESVLLRRDEVAKRLNISERTVRRYGKSGLLDERHIGPRLVRYTPDSVEALARGTRTAEAA